MKAVKINRINPNNVKPIFINDFEVGHNQDTFFLVFSQVDPPRDPPEEIDAVQQAKFICTPQMAGQILNALALNIERSKTEGGLINDIQGSA